MSSRHRLSQTTPASVNKLGLDSLNKILKIGSSSKSKKHKSDTIAKQVSRVALAELLKNTSTYQDIPDFKLFLSDKDNIHVFREFLKTQYCQENIDFYLACEKFRQLDPDKVGKDLIKFMANQIYNDHLAAETAKQPVNIDHNCLQNIIKQMKDPKPDMLCDAQAEIFDLMRNDCYPRFCKTYRIDKETARKILFEKPAINSTPRSRANNTTMTSITTNPDLTISSSSQCTSCSSSRHRGVKRKSLSQSISNWPSDYPNYRVGLPCQQHFTAEHSHHVDTSYSSSRSRGGAKRKLPPESSLGCSPGCPFDRVGLPCQNPRHNRAAKQRHIEQTGSSDLIDEIDMRRIHHVPNICKRRTPPPPPLPPKPGEPELSPVFDKKFCPYVGKVFDV